MFRWPWYWHLPRLAPWLLLAAAIVLPRVNRDSRTLLIVIPMLVLSVLWGPVTKLMGLPSLTIEQFSLVFESFVLGVALLWLNTGAIFGHRGPARFFVDWGTIAVAAAVVFLSQTGSASEEALLMAVAAILGIAQPAALFTARKLARGSYLPVSFMLWLTASGVLFSTLPLVGFAVVVGNAEVLVVTVITGLAFGLCLAAINLPYMLLMYRSPFFRERFLKWLAPATHQVCN